MYLIGDPYQPPPCRNSAGCAWNHSTSHVMAWGVTSVGIRSYLWWPSHRWTWCWDHHQNMKQLLMETNHPTGDLQILIVECCWKLRIYPCNRMVPGARREALTCPGFMAKEHTGIVGSADSVPWRSVVYEQVEVQPLIDNLNHIHRRCGHCAKSPCKEFITTTFLVSKILADDFSASAETRAFTWERSANICVLLNSILIEIVWASTFQQGWILHTGSCAERKKENNVLYGSSEDSRKYFVLIL